MYRRMRFINVVILAGTLLYIADPVLADPPLGYKFVSYDEGLRKASQSRKKVFIYFGREGCGYCDFTNKNAFETDEVKSRYQSHYEMVYIDAESGKRLTLPSGERITEREIGVRYKAFVTPVFVFTKSDGTPIIKKVGVQKKQQLIDYDKYINENHYKKMSYQEFEKTAQQ